MLKIVKWHFVFKIFLGTANVIEACSKSNVQYCVYTSSTSVVGPNANGDPFTNGNEATSYPIKPATNYDNTKLVAEEKIIKANGKVLSNGKLSILCVYTWLTLLLLVIGVIATCRYQSQKNSTKHKRAGRLREISCKDSKKFAGSWKKILTTF